MTVSVDAFDMTLFDTFDQSGNATDGVCVSGDAQEHLDSSPAQVRS